MRGVLTCRTPAAVRLKASWSYVPRKTMQVRWHVWV